MTAKKKILVIDDEPDLVKMIKVRLEAEGYEVVPAFDGTQGIQIAHKEKPDLIVLDILMPAMDGHKVCDALKMSTNTWGIPIIFLTAKTSKADETRAYKSGASYFLRKPYEPQVLVNTVRKALEPNGVSGQERESSKLILMVNANQGNATKMKEQLKKRGYKVLNALDLEKGLKKSGQEKLKLILLDSTSVAPEEYSILLRAKYKQLLRNIPILVTIGEDTLERLKTELFHLVLTGYTVQLTNTANVFNNIVSILNGDTQSSQKLKMEVNI